MDVGSYIWITTSFEGIHNYPDAPETVAFLRNDHRHIFHIKVFIEVFHDDRDIEFILFKQFVNSCITDGKQDHKSCEMISDNLYNLISYAYPDRDIKIEISEDKENGSFKSYPKD